VCNVLDEHQYNGEGARWPPLWLAGRCGPHPIQFETFDLTCIQLKLKLQCNETQKDAANDKIKIVELKK
jgi:hypothetical protein